MRYLCCDERRLTAVRLAGVRNGVDYVEVSDSDAPAEELRQRTLFVRLLLPAAGLDGSNVRIEGGERIRGIAVEWAAPADALPAAEDPALVDDLDELDHVLVVRTAARGDFSTYTLRLVAGPGSTAPPAGFDPLLAGAAFSFKVECGSDFDCRDVVVCAPERPVAPALDYLAKDYASFRRLLLDRISLLAPDWRERSPADLGVTLVELLAYVADRYSYQQDAVATEAYLGTARRRVSLRRHARLVDYAVHEGCAARVLARIQPATPGVTVPARTPLLTRVPGLPARFVRDGREHRAALDAGATTFETVEDAVLYPDHAELCFWTWGDRDCCLPAGATRATLRGAWPTLKPGDVLILAETVSPTTGQPADADVSHRWPVRLTQVLITEDPSGGLFEDPPHEGVVPVTEIAWDEADALPFPLCLTATRPAEGDDDATYLEVAIAWGNVVVADHGRSVTREDLGVVPAPARAFAPVASGAPCAERAADPVPVRYRPTLRHRPVTHVVETRPPLLFEAPADAALVARLTALAYDGDVRDWLVAHGLILDAGPVTVRGGDGTWAVSDGRTVLRVVATATRLAVYGRAPAAVRVTAATPRGARPEVVLTGRVGALDEEWLPRADLLASGDAREFVVEPEHDGTASLRFGDGTHGRRPETGTAFAATYRVGNGFAGNVGAGSLAHLVTSDGGLVSVANPLPAAGGVDPEDAEQVRRDAPEAFTVQERAVTPADYAEKAELHPQVQRAAATFRWTGSWYTVFVTVDRYGGADVTPEFEAELRAHLERYRMAGYDLEVNGPAYVALDVAVHVCVRGDHFRAPVAREVRRALAALFRPDALTFGQPVHLSAVYAAAQSVPGVDAVRVTTFRRRGDTGAGGLDTGVLPMGRLEIPRLDDDPSLPEHGALRLTVGGGK